MRRNGDEPLTLSEPTGGIHAEATDDDMEEEKENQERKHNILVKILDATNLEAVK
jgi:hypothetical protein